MKNFPGIFYQFVKRNISSKQYFILVFSDISTQFPNRTTLSWCNNKWCYEMDIN